MKYQPDQAWKKEERKENIYSPLKKEKKRNKFIDIQFELTAHTRNGIARNRKFD